MQPRHMDDVVAGTPSEDRMHCSNFAEFVRQVITGLNPDLIPSPCHLFSFPYVAHQQKQSIRHNKPFPGIRGRLRLTVAALDCQLYRRQCQQSRCNSS